MEKLAQFYLPLPRDWKWPKVNIAGLVRSLGDALDLYRKAIAMAYVTALVGSCDVRNKGEQCLGDEDLEGRDPRW